MGVSSSLYSSISGLSSMGEAMSVLGDNVANVNTVSFKSSRTTFQDVLAQSVSTASGASQVGRGVTLSTVSGLFAQGSFESSSSATDMAIGGQGFFMLRAEGSSEADMYSRAGEFSFDQEGFIVNPVGHFAQGWTIDSVTGERAGTIGDMRIDKTTPPVATQEVEIIANLDSREINEANEIRLFDSWDGTNASAVNPTEPIDSAQFEYTTAIKMYDSKGASHDITVYFDRSTNDNEWEFLVTSQPGEDKRVLDAREQLIYAPAETYDYETHKGAGALMYGLIQFDTAGNIQEITAYDVPPDGNVDPSQDDNRIILDPTDTNYSFEANFTGAIENDQVLINFGAQYAGVDSGVRQSLVSELGARAGSAAGSSYITSETTWSNVYDSSSMQLTGNGVATESDEIELVGFKNDGTRVISTYLVNSDDKVQAFLTQVGDDFGANATIDALGRLKITDLSEGVSGLNIVSLTVRGDADTVTGVPEHDDVNPFGETSVNGDTVINITSAKQKVVSQGQMLNSADEAITTADVTWGSVYDASGGPFVGGEVFTFDGTAGDNTAVSATYTVAVDNTVQDLLDWLETTFDADAEIDGAGRLVLTDRVADSATYTSNLAVTGVSMAVGTDPNPWDDVGATASVGSPPVDVLVEDALTGPTGSAFYTIAATVSGEDGSVQGTRVSSSFSPEALSTTQYANSSTTIFQDQNGFASGFLQSVSVDTEGTITGNYSNGQVLKKAQIALANFSNLAGLFKQGGNIFTETTSSGAPVTGTAGTNGLGSIAPNALEQSNVDLGAEFVKLITVQRGFQANSKIITTTDEMMSDLINMKR